MSQSHLLTRVVSMPARLHLARDVGLHRAEAVLVPLGLFYGIVVGWGLHWALVAALTWAYLAIAVRMVRGVRPPALLVVATAVTTLRILVTFLADSATVYFLQPTLATYLFAGALLGTLRHNRPLIQRLAHDFCPLPPDVTGSPLVRRLFQRLSVLWAAVLLVNATTTLGLLLTLSTTWSIPVATVLSVPAFVIGLLLSLQWFRRTLRDAGYRLAWGHAG